MPPIQDLLARIKAMQGGMSREGVPDLPPIQPPVAPPREPEQADPRLAQISALQQQAGTDPRPRPDEDDGVAKRLLFAAIQGLRGSAHPKGYSGMQAESDLGERARQQDLLSRIQSLQGGVNADRNFGLQQRVEASNVEETARARKIQEDAKASDILNRDFGNRMDEKGRIETERHNRATEAAALTNATAPPKPGAANLQMKQAILKGGDSNKPVPVNYDTDGTQGPAGRVYSLDGQDITNQIDRLFDPVVLPGFDPGSGQPAFTQRSNAVSGGVIPLPPAATLESADDSKKAVANINNLGKLYNPAFVGPVQGRVNTVKGLLPEGLVDLPPGYAEFQSASSALKSDVIKAITGAQMNQQEEQRILESIPTGNDRSDVWDARYKQLVQRVNVIAALKQQRVGLASYTLEDLDKIANGTLKPGGTPAPTGGKEQFSPSTKQYRHSLDGGKTWNPGRLPR